MSKKEFKCEKCGETMSLDTSVVLTSYPAMYTCFCEKCGHIQYIYCSEQNNYKWKRIKTELYEHKHECEVGDVSNSGNQTITGNKLCAKPKHQLAEKDKVIVCYNCGKECKVHKCSCGAEDWQCECGCGVGHTCEKRLKETKMLVDRAAEIAGTILELKQQLAEKDRMIDIACGKLVDFEYEQKEGFHSAQFWKERIESLAKQELTDKDEEIEKLKTIKNAIQFNKTQSIVEGFEKKLRKDKVLFTFNSKEMSQHDAAVCHQICEKIREWCEENEFEVENADQSSDCAVYTYKQLFKKLDQIEKGEKI